MRLFRLMLAVLLLSGPVAMTPSAAQEFSQVPNIPNFWDPNVRQVKPENLNISRLRFLTTTDFPPFNFIDREKRLNGFHIDLAREICAELDILPLCQIQAVPWDDLRGAIDKGEGEAIIAGLEITAETRKQFDFSMPFLQIPARFAISRTNDMDEPMVQALINKTTALVKGSSQAKYFKAVFADRKFVEFNSLAEAKSALLAKKTDALFTDAVSLAFWLPSQAAENCCRFAGGPYISREYFGNGLTISVAKGNPKLVDAINFALRRISDKGTFRELYLRYFPLSLY